MKTLRDRHGRRVEVLFSGGGLTRAAGEAEFAAALRLKARLAGAGGAALCSRGVASLLGFRPELAEVRLGGRAFRLAPPADLGAFFSDLRGIVLRDQYDAAGVKGGVVADCGANIGIFSLYALARGARRVFAFEAVKETFALLRKNLALNGSPAAIVPACAALGAGPGRAELKFNTCGEGSAMIGGEDTVNAGISYAARRAVRLRPLDSLLKGRVDFIKIDVEGMEREVLLGAAGLIRRWKPRLSFAAYHRETDPAVLRAAVRGIRPGYRARLAAHAEKDLLCRFR